VNIAAKTNFIKFPSILIAVLATGLLFTPAAHADWYFGIGTGLAAMKTDGKQGFDTVAGPVKFDVKMDPKDFRDLTKSAFGFGGYATDGKWLVQYSLANLELQDKSSAAVGASTVAAKFNFKIHGAELTVGYPFYKSPSLVMLLDVGVRYTEHKFHNSISVSGNINAEGERKFSDDWTDALVGVTMNVPFANKWTWATRVNGGFGGSDGTFFASTGLTWRFHKNWSAGVSFKYTAVDYENGKPGDSDWYFYDADESSAGFTILYNW
jgi:hypothetical protein